MEKSPDGENGRHTFTLALVARALALLKADSEVLTSLVEELLDSAFRNENGDLSSWGRFAVPDADHARGLAASDPSVAHTAMAALSLREVFIATGGRLGCSVSDLTSVRTWLLEAQAWGDITEDINRPFPKGDKQCKLAVKHFTRTWVVRALLALGADPGDERIRRTVEDLAGDRQDGLWKWGNDLRLIWATHDALSTLEAYSKATPAFSA